MLFVNFVLAPNKIDQPLGVLNKSLPDPIATYDYELIIWIGWDLSNVWFTGYHLLIVFTVRVSFVVEIAE